ncbi:type II toxin-antitoxin system prevent-host-death family antitoxin [Candidatus Acetothermia bacterium]|nr:type II toxin-antitoxin system prevent-host-death family antitoxin [Candidatus Acetothermia bacterium]
MTIVTAKELKNKTGQVLKRVREGKEVVVTVRGVPVAKFVPVKKSIRTSTLDKKRQAQLQAIEEGLGKYKGILSVDELLRMKQEEIELEEGM